MLDLAMAGIGARFSGCFQIDGRGRAIVYFQLARTHGARGIHRTGQLLLSAESMSNK